MCRALPVRFCHYAAILLLQSSRVSNSRFTAESFLLERWSAGMVLGGFLGTRPACEIQPNCDPAWPSSPPPPTPTPPPQCLGCLVYSGANPILNCVVSNTCKQTSVPLALQSTGCLVQGNAKHLANAKAFLFMIIRFFLRGFAKPG